MINWGLICEGAEDIASLPVLFDRLSASIDIGSIHCPPVDCGGFGNVLTKLEQNIAELKTSGCNGFLIHSDVDDNPKKIRAIKDRIAKINASGDFAVGMFPDPNTESWLIADDAYLKKIFNLPGAAPLPFAEVHDSKIRLLKLSRYWSGRIEPTDLYSNIASHCDLATLLRSNNSFQSFRDALVEVKNRCRN